MVAEESAAGGDAALPSSGDIRALSEQFGVVHRALRRDQLWIRFLLAVVIGLGAWIVVQQFALNARTAQADRQDRQIAQLAHQNAAKNAADARNARALCLRLHQTRAVIVTVWHEVQFVPGTDRAALLARVDATESLPKCPGGGS